MKYLITKRPHKYNHLKEEVNFEFCGFSTLFSDIQEAKFIQFDTETDMIDTKKHPELTGRQHSLRKLHVLQFGMNSNRYVIDYHGFVEEENKALAMLFRHDIPFIIHNAAFDYTVLKAQLGIELRNIHDTFLMSKVLNMGTTFEEGYHSLQGCLERFYGIPMDKSEQKGFNGEVMTASQLEYAFNDVLYLEDLYTTLKELMEARKVYKIYDDVERKVLAPLCDMQLNRMRFDKEHWAKVGEHLKEEREDGIVDLTNTVLSDPGLVEYLKDDYDGMPLITAEDVFRINWRSPKFKKLAYSLLFPKYDYLELSTKQKLNKVAKAEEDEKYKEYFQDIIAGNYSNLDVILKRDFKNELDEAGYYTPANTSMINWNSSTQKLKIFNYYYPQLTSTGQKATARLSNALLSVYRKFSAVNKACSTYGENFVRNYVDENSTIAPVKLGQILDTGRIASTYQGPLNSDIKVNTPLNGETFYQCPVW